MGRTRLLLATLAAYLPAGALPALAGRAGLPGGPLDPSVLVVPFCLGFAVAFPLWGRRADRTAPETVIRVALGLMVGAGALVALAPSPVVLGVGRALQGLAAAGVPPAVQAQLARDSGRDRAGRALSGMMLAVALATLGGPAAAVALYGSVGWTAVAAAVCCALPLGLIVTARPVRAAAPRQPQPARPSSRPGYDDPQGVRAGWLVSALVLGGHWTVLTRLAEALGSHGLGGGSGLVAGASLTGAAGLPLVVLAARASDTAGPRRPMTVTLLAGAAGFALAATAQAPAVFVAAVGVGLACYWAYLPVVAAQVQLSSGPAARGRAAGGLYASMWTAAALAGVLASLAPSWRIVLAGAALSWACAAAIAARGFHGRPARAPDSLRWPSRA